MYYLINSKVHFPLCFSVLTRCSVDGQLLTEVVHRENRAASRATASGGHQ